MIVKIAVTAIIVLFITAFHLATIATNRALGPEDYQIDKRLHNAVKAIAVISLWTIVGCAIAAVWTR